MNEPEFEWKDSDFAHPGKRYQGQFIDGLISLAIFALCAYIVAILEVSSEIVDVTIILIPFLYFVLSDALPKGQSLAGNGNP